MAERYLKIIEVDGMRKENEGVLKTPHVVVPNNPANYYCVGHDLVTLLVLPTLQLLGQGSLGDIHGGMSDFITHLLFWKDGTFEIWGLMPFRWLYHVYWPTQLLNCILMGKGWSRINVSTTKMFKC